jgi:poly(A) polymerase
LDYGYIFAWGNISVLSLMKLGLPGHLKDLAKKFHDNQKEFFLVGGALRDQIIGKPHEEWDGATNARPEDVITILKKSGCKKINEVGKRFGTIACEYYREPLEITTYRTEQYLDDSRKPEVRFGSNLLEDLSRRDFTINALAYDPLKDNLIDQHQGLEDIRLKIIRAVGNPQERFNEDPLRMLRAIRFATTLNFTISRETLTAIIAEKHRFGVLSAERIQQEINKILLAPTPSIGMELLRETSLIAYVLPELIPSIDLKFDPREHKDIYHHILQVLDNTPPKLELRWCALLHDIAKPLTRKKIGGEYHFLGHENLGAKTAKIVLGRLKYPNSFINYVSKLVRLHQRLPNDDGQWTDGAVRRFVRDAGETLDDLFIFAEADSTGKNERKIERYRQKRKDLKKRIEQLERQAEIAKLTSPLSGEDLMRIFRRPAGPWIKPIKQELLRQVIEGELNQQDKVTAEKIAKKLISNDNNEDEGGKAER